MPAWGGSHDDPTIWSMVAFLNKLPDMTPRRYKDLLAKAPPDDDMVTGAGIQRSPTSTTHMEEARHHGLCLRCHQCRRQRRAPTVLALQPLRWFRFERLARAVRSAWRGQRPGVACYRLRVLAT